jgi:uroporphyrinogen-III synthase
VRPLEGRTIWCTRPGRAGERSCFRLHELGATIHHAPTVRICPVVPDAEDLAELHRVAAGCVVALTSPRGALHFVEAVGPQRPDGQPWPAVAVGQKTAIQAKELGFEVLGVAPRATARDLVPSVLAADPAEVVVVPGSNLRRPELADGLRDRGRRVLELQVHETVSIDGLPSGLPPRLQVIDLLVAYSPSALAFVRSLGEQDRQDVLAIPVAVMGSTTGAEARALGLEVAVEPDTPHEDHLIGLIRRWLEDRG